MAFERREYVGAAPSTTLNGDILAGTTSITIASGTGYPTGSVGPFFIVIDPGTASEEKVKVTSRSGTTLTVATRGADGTTAAAHSSGATVQHVFTKTDADEANQHYADTALDHHTQYLNTTRHDTTARHGSSVVDHGSIGGLSDDDHTQYLNTTRHDTTARHGSSVVDHGSIGGLSDDDHTQYALASGTRGAFVTKVWISAPEMFPSLLSPTLAITSATTGVPVWLMDAAVIEGIAGTAAIPDTWATTRIDLWWTNVGAGSGDVVFAADRQSIIDGFDLTTETTGGAQTFTAPAQNIVEVTTLVAAQAYTATNGVPRIEVRRRGSDAADTLANDIGILGVMLVKVS